MDAHAISTSDPIDALKRVAGVRNNTLVRKIAPVVALLAAAVAAALVAPGIAQKFGDALSRAVHANPAWVVAAVAFELASFAGYILLFWHVAGRASDRIGFRAAGEIALASTAATRLLPTAGAGGAALTFWSLRRSGLGGRDATSTLLAFLVVLYSIFLTAIFVSGALIASGAVASDVSPSLALVASAAALVAMALAVVFGLRHDRSLEPSGKLATGVHAIGGGVRDALALVLRPHVRLLGAPAWWAFDLLVLWATFSAFGGAPSPLVLVLGYFLGQVANTIPLPGAASGGMVGSFLAMGVAAPVVLPAVLAYRAIAIWTPVPIGGFAMSGLRRRVRAWAEEDGVEPAAEAASGALIQLPVRFGAEHDALPLAA